MMENDPQYPGFLRAQDEAIIPFPRPMPKPVEIQKFLNDCDKIREGLKSVADPNTHIDSGGGMGGRDFWVKINGTEYFVQVTQAGINA